MHTEEFVPLGIPARIATSSVDAIGLFGHDGGFR